MRETEEADDGRNQKKTEAEITIEWKFLKTKEQENENGKKQKKKKPNREEMLRLLKDDRRDLPSFPNECGGGAGCRENVDSVFVYSNKASPFNSFFLFRLD